MKTKNLLTGVALSAMFAACTQDVELNEAIAKNDFSNIPMVEADFTVNAGAESRLATKFGWEKGDIVGFAWDGNLQTADGKAYANNPLYCLEDNSTKFDGQSMYYVGNYFAYVPYSELKSINYIPFSIKGQTLSTELADYAKYKIMISPSMTELVELQEGATLATGEQEAGRKKNYPLYLSELSNFAKIQLSFKNAENLADLTVNKVTLDLIGGNNSTSIMPLNFNFNATGYADVVEDEWKDMSATNFYNNYVATDSRTNGSLILENKNGLSVTNNALTTYAVVLPTLATTIESLNVTVETNYGVMTATAKVIAQGQTADKAAAVSATTELFTKFGTTGTIVAELDAKTISMGAETTVKSQAELNEVLNKLVAIKEKGAYTINLAHETATSPTSPFVLTDFTMPEGLATNWIVLKATDKTNGVIEFAGNSVINKQVVLGTPATVTGTMTVNYIKNANFTITAQNSAVTQALTIGHGATLINNGIIKNQVITLAADEENELSFGKYINNAKEATLEGTLNNLGEAQWIAGSKPTMVEGSNGMYAEAANLNEISAADNAKIRIVRLINATIENKGDNFTLSNVKYLECYDDVKFELTASNNGLTRGITFEGVANVAVKENAKLEVVGGTSVYLNLANTAVIEVEENAVLDMQNITTAATVNNAGVVTIYNCPNIVKGNQEDGSSWSYTQAN